MEILVALAVISLLLALTLGAISRARSEARRAACTSSLRSGIQFQTAFAESHNRGRWPNIFEPGTGVVVWVEGETQYVTDDTIDQTSNWLGPMVVAGYLTPMIDEARGIACPEARRLYRYTDSQNYQAGPEDSYHYSAALYTSADLWDPAFPNRRAEPNDFRQSVPLADVRHPDRKVSLFEIGDYHRSGLRINRFRQPGFGRCNVACCDGHVVSADPYADDRWLDLPWSRRFTPVMPFEGAMPFSSAPHGFRGLDVDP
ncbi:MAG: hypothetical protein AB7K52_10840 [Phycisphaerales bacterium]